jgi:hypothetical protein
MNNTKIRPRMSVIELRMILTDMEDRHFTYSKEVAKAHWEFILRLRNFNK